MSRPFPVGLPLERAFTRNVLFAVEILDAVTLTPIRDGIRVTASGMRNGPIVNASGIFVWLEDGANKPQTIKVDAGGTVYEDGEAPAPILPARLLRMELAPTCAYPFPPGATALRGTLIESTTGTRRPVAGAEAWLQWVDQSGPNWLDAPTRSHTNINGDFGAIFRQTPSQDPVRLSSGGLRVRLRVRRGNTTKSSAEFPLFEGRVGEGQLPFAWADFV